MYIRYQVWTNWILNHIQRLVTIHLVMKAHLQNTYNLLVKSYVKSIMFHLYCFTLSLCIVYPTWKHNLTLVVSTSFFSSSNARFSGINETRCDAMTFSLTSFFLCRYFHKSHCFARNMARGSFSSKVIFLPTVSRFGIINFTTPTKSVNHYELRFWKLHNDKNEIGNFVR